MLAALEENHQADAAFRDLVDVLLLCSIMQHWAESFYATFCAASEECSLLRSEPSLAVSSAELQGVSRPPRLSTLGTRCASLHSPIADPSQFPLNTHECPART